MKIKNLDNKNIRDQDPPAPSPRQHLKSLQAIRAIAALMVVVFHMNIHTLPDTFGVRPLWSGLNMGYAGVDIFFVLSGFIMFFRHGADFGKPERARSYIYARCVRIFPVFWIVMCGVLALRYAAYQAPLDFQSIVVSGLLLPIFDQHILGVQWSLSFEMLFYLVFCFAILNTRIGIAVMALWFGACIIVAMTEKTGASSRFFFSPYNIQFLFGIIGAMVWKNVSKFALLLVLVGAALFITVGLSEVLGFMRYSRAPRTILYGLSALAVICGAASLEHQNIIKIPSFMVFLGNASYAIYLVHITAMSATALVVNKLGLGGLPVEVLAVLALLSAICAGSLIHALVENPILKLLRGNKSNSTPTFTAP